MAPLGAEPRRSTKLVLAGPSPPCALRGAATEAPTVSFSATESKARSAPVGTRHSWRSKLRGGHRLPEQCPRMVLQWGAETQGSPGPAKWLPSTPLPLGMVASGSSSKVRVDYANAAPLSAIPLIDVFACFLQACQPRAIIYLPIPILS